MLFPDPEQLSRDDLAEIDLIRPEEWPPYRATFEHYFSTDCCQPYGVKLGGHLVAMGTLIRFEHSAWIAQLITSPDHRGKGLGSAVLTFLIRKAHELGVQTLSLVATAQGQPLYTRVGFRIEGEYGFFHRASPAGLLTATDNPVSDWTSGDSDAMAELDFQVSGERRRPYWNSLQAGGRTIEEGGELAGFWLPQVGEGLIVARSATTGTALLEHRLQGSDRVVVPLENPVALEVLRARGFKEARRAKRMVLGPSLVRKPEHIWSRIGGNLG